MRAETMSPNPGCNGPSLRDQAAASAAVLGFVQQSSKKRTPSRTRCAFCMLYRLCGGSKTFLFQDGSDSVKRPRSCTEAGQ